MLIASDAVDMEAATGLLAWMMSPQVVAEVACDTASLPASRTAARDPRFAPIGMTTGNSD